MTDFRHLIFKCISAINFISISSSHTFSWMAQEHTDIIHYIIILVHVMAWFRQAISHYLSQCWPRSLSASLGHNELRSHQISLLMAKRHYLNQLEQLERLRSEDTPRCLMITHTIESYRIPSQNENIGQGQRSSHVTYPLMLMMICAKYGKNASRIVDFFTRWKPKN